MNSYFIWCVIKYLESYFKTIEEPLKKHLLFHFLHLGT